MKVLIHDLTQNELNTLLPKISNDIKIISNDGTIEKCIGCFSCWIKTPCRCILKDNYRNLGSLYSKCDEIIILTRCCYGCYSPFIKNVLDRSINYILPYFTMRNNEMHHTSRYKNKFKLSVYAYGENITDEEKETMKELVTANVINFNARAGILPIRSLETLNSSDAIVFAFPLYVDSLPSHFLRFLEALEIYFKANENHNIRVYAISNCGFYEGEQNRIALKIIENWCHKCNLIFAQGLGIGGGPVANEFPNVELGHAIKKDIGLAINTLCINILNDGVCSNIYASINFPKRLYIFEGNNSWTAVAKKNGLKKKDICSLE